MNPGDEAFLQDRIERLEERCEAYKGQVKVGAARIEQLESLIRDFIKRVDEGEIRSHRTYMAFKRALKGET